MELQGKGSIGFLDLGFGGGPLQPQYLVEVFLGENVCDFLLKFLLFFVSHSTKQYNTMEIMMSDRNIEEINIFDIINTFNMARRSLRSSYGPISFLAHRKVSLDRPANCFLYSPGSYRLSIIFYLYRPFYRLYIFADVFRILSK